MGFLSNTEEFLSDLVGSLRLDDSRLERMKNSYSSLSAILENDEQFFGKFKNKIDVYAQGSVSLGTSIKPQGSEEFDLDLVMHIKDIYKKYTPADLYNNLYRVLKADKRYSDKVKGKNRCVRIEYKNDFHVDVLPAFSADPADKSIMVPDRELQSWTKSNPKDFTDWFINIADSTQKLFSMMEHLDLKEFNKIRPLKDAVMLLKMYRNQYFAKKNKDDKVPSIILTTLAALSYKRTDSVYETVENFISYCKSKFVQEGIFSIKNPVEPSEDFSERWKKNPRIYSEFKSFINGLNEKWAKFEPNVILESSREDAARYLFGEEYYNRGFEHFSERQKSIMLERGDYSGLLPLAKTNSKFQKPYTYR